MTVFVVPELTYSGVEMFLANLQSILSKYFSKYFKILNG